MLAMLAVAAGATGCGWPPADEPPTPPPADVEKQQEAKLEQLHAQIRALSARNEDLSSRSLLLAKEVTRLQFLNDQLNKQLAAVGDAPHQRDLYKQRVQQLQAEAEALRKRVEELETLVKPPATRPVPASKPAPATRPSPPPK